MCGYNRIWDEWKVLLCTTSLFAVQADAGNDAQSIDNKYIRTDLGALA